MEKILSQFKSVWVPAVGLTPHITIRLTDDTVVINAESMVEVGNWWYEYDFVGYQAATTYLIDTDWGPSLANTDRYQSTTNVLDSYQNKTARWKPAYLQSSGGYPKGWNFDPTTIINSISKELKSLPKVDMKSIEKTIKDSEERVSKKIDSMDNKATLASFWSKIDKIIAQKSDYLKATSDLFYKFATSVEKTINDKDFTKEIVTVIDAISNIEKHIVSKHDMMITKANEIVDGIKTNKINNQKIDDLDKKVQTTSNDIRASIRDLGASETIAESLKSLSGLVASVWSNMRGGGKNNMDATIMEGVVMKGINMVIDTIIDTQYNDGDKNEIIGKLEEIKSALVK